MSVVLATGGYDHKIRFWEAPSGRVVRIIKHSDSQVNRLEITPDKQFIAAAGNPAIRLYEIFAGQSPDSNAPASSTQPVLTLEGHKSNVTAIGFQSDGRYLYSSSEDGTIKIWDLRNPDYSKSFDVGAPVQCVTLRLDRDEFISGDQNGNVKIWDLRMSQKCINQVKPDFSSNNRRQHFTERSVTIQDVDISEDSRTLVAATNHGNVFVWDPSGATMSSSGDLDDSLPASFLRPVTKFRAHSQGTYLLRARIAPDCRHLVTTSSDGTAKLWDTTTWELVSTLQSQKWVWDAAFCADSSYLTTASSDSLSRLWNLRTGKVVKEYVGHQSAVTCVALNDNSV